MVATAVLPARRDLPLHRVSFPRGPTAADNLDAACRTHHTVKTLTDTTVTRDADGAVLVRLPSGRGYRRRADPVLDDPADPPY